MTAVVLSRKLTIDLSTQFGAAAPYDFASEFQLWKNGGIGYGDTFGKNSLFARPPELVRLGMEKVHLETQADTARWNSMMDQGVTDPNAYTSNRVLVYSRLGDMQYQPFLLLQILDPGHAFMQDPSKVATLALFHEMERAAFAKRVIGDNWVVAGMP
ncbi:type II toxin-antitoxin system YafO family toxin [Pseudomonas nicosulfuronedens]|uniref:type II toxin-antitoxin system YafO family toxin n=1 Tax=Pseudomonas nicosulfuronedens TaxID=2571105 RepID=UPI00244C7346|nr:type II toxin-antitoxin system YafO family toxin [Pseudomonas nicosulfuronedens]MDH1012320.1 type II toxin-antitoxin system YafO family toxin [Pseudomonas nicosulfuronedens]MDH2030489.1 type II toxin-antitoxin system YafO family toxin [Pseudomonas nicosulfuronedens]